MCCCFTAAHNSAQTQLWKVMTLPGEGLAKKGVPLGRRIAPMSSRNPTRNNSTQTSLCNVVTLLSVPGHALRCGPETSVTSPLRWRWFELSGHERTYIQPSRPWECGNPEGISTECGKGGKPASWLSMLSILCHFHDLLFARHCWINRNATQRHAPRSPRTKIPAHWRKRRAIRTGYLAS
jgi:hypothetical protein